MEYLLTFQNTHYAVHSEKVLLENQISVNVMPLPSSLGNLCGICLRIKAEELVKSQELLKIAEIPIEKIFSIEIINNERMYQEWKS